jgi:hypothetical protein
MKPPDLKNEKGDRIPEIEDLREAPQSPASARDAIRRAQAVVRLYIPEGQNLADELIAERRGKTRP